MKNAGVGVGLPDTGRCRLAVEDGRVHIFAGASCIGQGLGTVLTQMVYEQTKIPRESIVYERANTFCAPDSGTTSGSRQTLFTGEACRRACQDLKAAMAGSGGLDALNGQEFYGGVPGQDGPPGRAGAQSGEPRGLRLRHPGVHPGRGGADPPDRGGPRCGQGREPHLHRGADRGRSGDEHGLRPDGAVPPDRLQAHRQIRHTGIVPCQSDPGDHSHHRGEAGAERGLRRHRHREITAIPTAPAIADAYYRYDGRFRTSLPLDGTPYSRK